jgi:hypothetical protein
MSSIHLDTLDDKRREAFLRLKSFKKYGYLAGGTALMLQIKHRRSFDFDIFLNREIKDADLRALKRKFLIREIGLDTSEQLDVLASNFIKITLVYYRYNPLFSLKETDSIPSLSIKDIAVDKAHTIGRRGRWRDYVDMFFILKQRYCSIPEIIRLAIKKFKEEFNAKKFLEQLTYFKDLDRFDISFIGKSYSEKEIKNYLIQQVKTYQQSIIKELRR